MGDIYIAAHLRRCLRHSVFGHVLQYTPSISVLDALHLHHAIKSPPLRNPSPLHITFIEVKNELVKMKDLFLMKVITHTITHQAKSAGGQIESIMYTAKFAGGYSHSIMYPAKFAGGRSRLDLLLPSFLPSRAEKKKQEQKNRPLGSRGVLNTPPKHLGRDEKKMQEQKNRPLGSRGVLNTPPKHLGRDEKKKQEQKNCLLGCRGVSHTPPIHPERDERKSQDRIFCPLRGHAVGRMQYAPTTCRQETLFPINSRKERIETKIQDQKNRPLGSRGVLHTPHMDRVRTETKMQDRIFCPLRGHAVGRMQYAPTSCQQETLYLINSQEERTETKMQERRKQSIGNGAEWHTPYMDRIRTETKMQEQIFCPLWGHAVGRMQYAPTSCRQERLFPINSQEERIETKMQKQKSRPSGSRGVLHTPHTNRVRTETKMQERKNCPSGSRGVLHTPHTDRVRIETKMQERRKQSIDSGAEWHTPHMNRVRIETKMQEQIFCTLRDHVVGRMQYSPTSCRQERLYPINSREERTETKMQERRKQSIDSGAEWHTPFMRQGERDAIWREAFLEQRARVTVWRDRRLEERSSHARLQLKTSGENSKPYKSSLVALSEQLRDIFAA